MKYILILLMMISCRSKHDDVDDEYSRGFFNALAITERRHHAVYGDQDKDFTLYPYWDECKRSYLKNQDLYNDWDSTYENCNGGVCSEFIGWAFIMKATGDTIALLSNSNQGRSFDFRDSLSRTGFEYNAETVRLVPIYHYTAKNNP